MSQLGERSVIAFPLDEISTFSSSATFSEITEASTPMRVAFDYEHEFSTYCPWADASIEYERLVQRAELSRPLGFVLLNERVVEQRKFLQKPKNKPNEIVQLFYRNTACTTNVQVSTHDGYVDVECVDNDKLADGYCFIEMLSFCAINLKGCELERVYLNTPNLVSINLGGTRIIDFDPSLYHGLLILKLFDTQISQISVVENSELEELNLAGTKISTIDLTECVELLILNLEDTAIDTLNLEHNEKLEQLYMSATPLRELDLTMQTALTHLDISETLLQEISVITCKELQHLYADRTDIKMMNLENNAEIEVVSIKECHKISKKYVYLAVSAKKHVKIFQ